MASTLPSAYANTRSVAFQHIPANCTLSKLFIIDVRSMAAIPQSPNTYACVPRHGEKAKKHKTKHHNEHNLYQQMGAEKAKQYES